MRERFAAAVDAWHLSDPEALGGGAVGLVCAAQGAVLKVNPRGHRDDRWVAGEGHALSFYEPTGAVAGLLGQRDDGFTLLLEQLEPGTPLDASGMSWEDRLELLGGLAARLHAQGAPPDTCISMSDFCANWPLEATRVVPPGNSDVLVHADLHGGNVLRHGSRWKAIDPKGVRGDRHADVWVLIEPDAPALPSDPGAATQTAWSWVTRYAEAAGMDPERAAAWTRARAYAEASMITDAEWAARLRAMGDALG